MSNVFKTSLLALALVASAGALTWQSASADRVVVEEPVIMSPGYQPYAAPPPPPYWGATEYIGPRPFSLHRFVGNAVGGSLGATKHVVFPSHHDRYYYY